METVILAAGSAKRMGGVAKLLLPYRGEALVVHVVKAALAATGRVILVTGCRAAEIEAVVALSVAQATGQVIVVRNEDFAAGQFASTQVGVRQLSPGSDFFITMADLPLIRQRHYDRLVPLLQDHDAVRPHHRGKPGHPVLHSRRLREQILSLPPDGSMRSFLAGKDVLDFEDAETAWIDDIDTLEEYLELTALD